MESNAVSNKSPGALGAAENLASRVGSAATNVAGATKEAGKQVGAVAKSEMAAIKQELDEFTARLPSLSDVDLQAAKEKLLAKIESAKVSAKSVVGDAREKLNHGVDASQEYVKTRPLQAVAIAAGFGLLVGLLVRRR